MSMIMRISVCLLDEGVSSHISNNFPRPEPFSTFMCNVFSVFLPFQRRTTVSVINICSFQENVA